MKCTLMHKNIAVSDIGIDEETSTISQIYDAEHPAHLPIGVLCTDNTVSRSGLNNWFRERSIPASRSGINNALETLGMDSTQMLLTHCYGLSLSDQYWIRPENSDLTWDKINFFQNDFSEDIGDMFFGRNKGKKDINLCSPDNTTDGCLTKRWKIIDNKRYLIKSGEHPFHQQPFNEKIASAIMNRLDIPHVDYDIIWQNGEPYSICEDFITPETELVLAWRIMQLYKKTNNESVYQYYTRLCREFGVKDIEHSLDQMMVLDYIIANEDRHFGNFGIVRNADTLEWISAAPVYDNGTSLGYNRLPQRFSEINTCKPFVKTYEEQLRLVRSYDWIDFSKLKDIDEEIISIMSDEKAKSVLGETRYKDISDLVKQRVSELEKIALYTANKTNNDF